MSTEKPRVECFGNHDLSKLNTVPKVQAFLAFASIFPFILCATPAWDAFMALLFNNQEMRDAAGKPAGTLWGSDTSGRGEKAVVPDKPSKWTEWVGFYAPYGILQQSNLKYQNPDVRSTGLNAGEFSYPPNKDSGIGPRFWARGVAHRMWFGWAMSIVLFWALMWLLLYLIDLGQHFIYITGSPCRDCDKPTS